MFLKSGRVRAVSDEAAGAQISINISTSAHINHQTEGLSSQQSSGPGERVELDPLKAS